MKKYFPALLYILLISCKQNEIITPSNKPIIEESLAPSGIKSDSAFINNSKIKIQISWNQINTSAYKSIKLYKGINSGPFSLTANLNTSEKKYVDSIDLKSNTTYNYKLSTINIKDVESPLTPEITVNTPKYIKFETGTGFNEFVMNSKITNDGKILCSGGFIEYNGQSAKYLIQLNNDGSIDNSFKPASVINDEIYTIAIQPDGKIIVGGNNAIFYRLNKDGSVDNSFNTGLGFKASTLVAKIENIILNNDGSIFVFGLFNRYNSTITSSVIKLKSDGSIDNSFDTKNKISGSGYPWRRNLVQLDGNILAAGNIKYDGMINGGVLKTIFRINKSGTIDTTSFKVKTNDIKFIGAVAQQRDGKILISGRVSNIGGVNNIIRFNLDGSIDNTFNGGSGTDLDIETICVQNDGKILLAGPFKKFNNISQNQIIRLNPDGTIDNMFNSGNGFYNLENTYESYAHFINVLGNGKILVTGGFSYYRGIKNKRIVLLNKDGSIADSMLH